MIILYNNAIYPCEPQEILQESFLFSPGRQSSSDRPGARSRQCPVALDRWHLTSTVPKMAHLWWFNGGLTMKNGGLMVV